MSRSWRRCYIYVLAVMLFVYLIYNISYPATCNNSDYLNSVVQLNKEPVIGKDGKIYSYDFSMPLIFIGGMPRSGTTLMRAMLDAHSEVRCGEETRVVPRIVQMRSHWLKSPKESMRLKEAGLENDVLNAAIRSFILEVIVRHGEPAPRLCNKDPFTMKYSTYLRELFPKAKFLFMVRDGRATVHSIITRKVTISGFDLKSYRQCLERWNTAVQTMYTQCRELGPEWCLPVYYEQLVLHPREVMEKILKFLDIPWEETVLHHEEEVGKPGGISISKVERSSDQIIKPVNLDALSKWVGVIPDDVVADMPNIAPMLSVLGYDPYANPPNYGKPDDEVQKLTKKIHENPSVWQEKAKLLLNRTHYVPEEIPKSFYDRAKKRHL